MRTKPRVSSLVEHCLVRRRAEECCKTSTQLLLIVWAEKTTLSETHATRNTERGTPLLRFVSFRSVSHHWRLPASRTCASRLWCEHLALYNFFNRWRDLAISMCHTDNHPAEICHRTVFARNNTKIVSQDS